MHCIQGNAETMRRYSTSSSLGGILGRGSPPHTQHRLQCWEKRTQTPLNLALLIRAIAWQEWEPLVCTLSTTAKHWLCEGPSAGKWGVHYGTVTATDLTVSPTQDWGEHEGGTEVRNKDAGARVQILILRLEHVSLFLCTSIVSPPVKQGWPY